MDEEITTAEISSAPAGDRLDARFRGFFDSITEYCYIISPEGRILDVNRAALDALGYRREELIGHPIASIYAPESRPAMEQVFTAWKRSGKVRNAELVVQTKDGRQRTVILNATAVRNADGSLRHSISVQHDITERKERERGELELERRLQQMQRLESLGVLAGGIAHDFNNILTGILGHAELAQSDLSYHSPVQESIAEIKKAALRAAELSSEMLAYAGKGRFETQDIVLKDLLESMLPMLKSCVSKSCTLHLETEQGLPLIHADPSQIRQIIMNLVINASEAMEERGGAVTLAVGATRIAEEGPAGSDDIVPIAHGDYLFVEVADQGEGMAPEVKTRIFEPFYTTKFTGRGLGLSAVLGIVRAHRGWLALRSKPGAGSVFRVFFPAASGDDPRPATGMPAASEWRGKGRVLLVDDEEMVRQISRKLLRHLGLDVLVAEDGETAVALYREHRAEIDLVLLDLTMPGMGGEAAHHELRKIDPEVRVVLASGYSESDVSSRFAGQGLTSCLQKPYTLAKLGDLLRGLLPAAGS